MTKLLKADFYRPNALTMKKANFVGILERVNALPRTSRATEISRCPVFLGPYEHIDSVICGDFIKLRVTDLPTKGKRSGQVSTIEMDEDESLSGHSAFLYAPRQNIFCLERNRNGVGSSTLCKYLTEKGQVDGAVGLDIVIAPDALKKVEEMYTYRALEVSIATFESATALKRQVPSVAGAIQMARELDAPQLHFKISMGHHKGALSRRVLETAREILGIADNKDSEVTMLKVHGREFDGEETEAIDLIRHRISFEENVPLSREHEEWYTIRRDFLRRAWAHHRPQLRELSRDPD